MPKNWCSHYFLCLNGIHWNMLWNGKNIHIIEHVFGRKIQHWLLFARSDFMTVYVIFCIPVCDWQISALLSDLTLSDAKETLPIECGHKNISTWYNFFKFLVKSYETFILWWIGCCDLNQKEDKIYLHCWETWLEYNLFCTKPIEFSWRLTLLVPG